MYYYIILFLIICIFIVIIIEQICKNKRCNTYVDCIITEKVINPKYRNLYANITVKKRHIKSRYYTITIEYNYNNKKYVKKLYASYYTLLNTENPAKIKINPNYPEEFTKIETTNEYDKKEKNTYIFLAIFIVVSVLILVCTKLFLTFKE